MDRQELAHHTNFLVQQPEDNGLLMKPPKTSLRSMSRSDPHLSMPHLILSQDEGHPSLNRIVSGLFRVDSALHTPHASCGNLQAYHQRELLDAMEDSKILSEKSSTLSQATALRRVSSSIDYATAALEKSRKNAVVEHSGEQNNEHMSRGRIASAACVTQPPPTDQSKLQAASGNQSHHGLLSSTFNRGFFSKPVIRSEEENYRYLMALDR